MKKINNIKKNNMLKNNKKGFSSCRIIDSINNYWVINSGYNGR